MASLGPPESGKFGRKARAQAHIERLAQFADRLQRALVATVGELRSLGALEASELTVEIGRRKALLEHLEAEADRRGAAIEAEAGERLRKIGEQADHANAELQRLMIQVEKAKSALVETQESLLLQEAGIYEYTHPLEDAVAYKSKLESIKNRYKALAKGDRAIAATTEWSVNGSAAKGRKMVRENSKLMLRAYNAEADNLVRTMKPFKLHSAATRLEKTSATIAKLGSTMSMRITPEYHRLRIEELELTADYLAKAAEEKERIREQRAREREEEKAQREMLREQQKLEKERAHLQTAIAKLTANGDPEGAAALTAKLDEVEAAFEGVKARQANAAAGHVYVISNLGAFGPNMVKIGMTRRLEPMDRVNELGDASVPFRFDVHALVYSEDARGLEARLHESFAGQRVNRVNQRREFFYATPAQVRDTLAEFAGEHLLQYTDEAEAYEWRASDGASRAD
ncbi:MAG TPA: DUF4041 domain-containing protein [Glycomyces sp.]|nr:DUF4041 domain-containing protein [Glycomyces sp.]